MTIHSFRSCVHSRKTCGHFIPSSKTCVKKARTLSDDRIITFDSIMYILFYIII